MDTLMLSRLQFAAAVFFHFIFVPLTLGLSIIVALMETRYVRTGDEIYKKMTKYWGKLFLINFALGIVTGITLEFQFGTNWSRYSAYVGDIFGPLLAIEASVAFFLESTMLGVWVFGWDKLSKKMHCAAIWMVAIASNLSALWIIIANGFMQNPLGYVMRNGRAELDDFLALITNPYAWGEYAHVLTAAYLLSGFFVMGVCAWHLLRKKEVDFYTRSFKYGVSFALIFSVLAALAGHAQGNLVAKLQPAKLAALEAQWNTEKRAPLHLLLVPGDAEKGNLVEALPIPGGLSFIAYNDINAEVKGLKDFKPEDRPPVAITFWSFRIMVGLGTLFIALAVFAWIKRNDLVNQPRLLRALLWVIPLPYIAIDCGWAVAEVGRQPWIVHGLMRTKDAVSPVEPSQVAVSLAAFIVVYAMLGAIDIYLLAKYAKKGPVH
ncbi:Cytochrome bd-I ubiquinol oxidase subunit 1 [Fundidesulfovibrio magnetotacticus]|uniref:Cytochrome bd-I ubiquinol oxidase subunit 1 n=1 Tax=Fundidesulfovibrio magnetotacticus TaxID=2730080 RepID=A0A6V8LQJ1_9BACT|nr:cytochrome ubiquinol oxidase subunit I [Fundidesulfovibrio magnetotacticus]GFK92399.1 Cytochrome bd-I ubiquinol oxidase subunit 1 [Fundidesulfovibrio magnetotacticus]